MHLNLSTLTLALTLAVTFWNKPLPLLPLACPTPGIRPDDESGPPEIACSLLLLPDNQGYCCCWLDPRHRTSGQLQTACDRVLAHQLLELATLWAEPAGMAVTTAVGGAHCACSNTRGEEMTPT